MALSQEDCSVSPTIQIDNEVFAELQKHAEPLIDTPNTVLRRVLGLKEPAAGVNGAHEANVMGEQLDVVEVASEAGRRTHRSRRASPGRAPRAKAGTILSETEYEIPILKIIVEHGGRAPAREVIDELETRLGGRLTDVDKQELSSGDVRWRNRAQFVRLRLVEQGDMVKDSPRGLWEITDQGQRRVGDAA